MKTQLLTLGFALCVSAGVAGCELIEDIVNGGGGQPGHPGNPGTPPQACTLIGCEDSFNATVTPKAGEFPSGKHEVIVTAEGSPVRTCTFDFPFPGPVADSKCDTGLMLIVAPLQECKSMTDGNIASQTCTPIPGKFEERLTVRGLPAKVRVTQRTVGGPLYLDREAAPRYEDQYPNGKQCGAVCKQAGVTWEL